ncbi:MAG TPA: class I tRNA ligase family protein [Candidatus Paceibacterota bacterium]|nr:class I tRNA ligase family protein [Candidatus Paceibacterota bacterium]
MTEPMESRYDHLAAEPAVYKKWEGSGAFDPDRLPNAKRRKPYTIIMPPPNANGSLHVGHAVFVTLEDIMIRYNRMRGRRALWLPGADHAGFETQVVYDKKLDKEGRKRWEIPREQLYREIWEFTQSNKSFMESQLRKLGASCDWSREKFTLDKDIVQTVYATFEQLYKDGLLYRDLKVVNWCPKHKTALSDLEVKYVEQTDPLYYMKYGPLTLATVRPETKFGDTALAVNPKDKRYTKYIGKEIEAVGILGPLKFRIIADDAVDPKFGTGVVKVTPAHDATDFEIWQRHKGEIAGPKIIIDENGRLTGDVGEFKGLKVAEARVKVAEAMQAKGILEKVDPSYVHQVATCYKCGTTLEPLPRPQWFVKTEPLAKKTLAAIAKKQVVFHPDRSRKVMNHWLTNIRDWNISRQIVWGIRIPAWYCLACGATKINPRMKAKWFLVRHGETDINKEHRSSGGGIDAPLNETGLAQARQTAADLKDQNIGLIVSSHLVRAKQTAEIIAKATGAPIIYEEDLMERHMGAMEGVHHDEVAKAHPSFWTDYEYKGAGNESYRELETRVARAFKKLKIEHGHKNVVIVSHGGSMRVLFKHLRNLEPSEALARALIPNGQPFELDIPDKPCACGGDIFEQDQDVFDTWFSSGQWPYAALGYPKAKDYKDYYPTDVMETAYDILFFWVARMLMLGIYRTGEVPFRHVYLHGLVRDKDRQKMSKSKGNVIDPLGVAETYGTDALRMALVVGNTAGNDIVVSEDKIRGYRNFATKIWNIARFVLMSRPAKMPKTVRLTAADKKHLATLAGIRKKSTKYLDAYDFNRAAETLYHYLWHAFADKVIESSKARLQSTDAADQAAAYRTLETILLECLTLLHPFMPFVTEAIYEKFEPKEILMTKAWPK